MKVLYYVSPDSIFAQDKRVVRESCKCNHLKIDKVLSSKPHGFPGKTLLP